MRPVNQNSNFKMKKIITFLAVSAMVSLAACGNGEEEAKRKADSTKAADSTASANAEAEAKRKADSTHMADSLRAKYVADSTHMADSTAKANEKKGGSPKPKPAPGPEQPKIKPGGRPGANK